VKFPGGGIAHGQAVSASNGVWCFGGTRGTVPNDTVYRISFTSGEIGVEPVSSLPSGFVPAAAAVSGSVVYLHGVRDGSNVLYSFSIGSGKWKELSGCPEGVRSECVSFVRQHNGHQEAFYLIGGRSVEVGRPVIYKDVWQYTPLDDGWEYKGPILPEGYDEPVSVMAAAALPYGSGHIVVSGGDDGVEFEERFALEESIRAEVDPLAKERLQSQLTRLFTSHASFTNDILAYHAITNTWIRIGTSELPLPVATTAVLDNGVIVLPGGELHPGVRSDGILSIRIREKATFGWVNYTVVAVYLLVMLALGFYFMRKENSTDQFFKGGGKIPWWAAGISIFATALSAITFLSIPAKAYGADWMMIMFNAGILLIVPVVIWFYLPYFRKLNVASAYEYLERRFSRGIRFLAAAFFCIFMFARVAIVLFLPSLAMNAVTGIDIYACIVMMGVVTIIYCTMGGIEAVVWGDVIQGIILVGGALISLVFMISGTGDGLSGFMRIAIEDDKFRTFDFSFDWARPVFWVTLIGGIANQLLTYTSDQSVVQRYMTTRDIAGAKKSIWLNGVLSIPVALIFFMIGTGLYVYFKSNPETLNLGMQNTDSIFPHFMMVRLPNGLAGLLISAVFAAAMSTLSANINSVSTVMTEDFLARIRPDIDERAKMKFARWTGIGIGGFGVAMAIVLATYDIASLWDQFNFFLGLLTSGLGGLFMMGIFFKRIDWRGALTGFCGSIVTLLLLNSWSSVSFLLYGLIGLVSCVAVGYVSSFIFPRRSLP
jgi:SSS family transporter